MKPAAWQVLKLTDVLSTQFDEKSFKSTSRVLFIHVEI